MQTHIPSRVNTIQEAEFLLRSTHELWAACHSDSAVALSQLEHALEEYSSAEDHLRRAEICVGQARSAIHHSGFGQLLITDSRFPVSNLSGELLLLLLPA
jgi:hypothetical protein